MDRIVGGWQISGVGRIQTGELLDFGNVRLVGMTEKELQNSVDLRVAANGQLFILPDDIIQNTVQGVQRRPHSATARSAHRRAATWRPPTDRTASRSRRGSASAAPGRWSITAPGLIRFDLSAVKRIQLRGRSSAEFRVEMLNALNSPYFNPNVNSTTVGGFTQQFTPTYEGALGRPADELDDDQHRQLPADDAPRRQHEPRHSTGLPVQLVGRRSASSIFCAS